VLQGRLTLLAAIALVLGACASVDGTDGGAIREAVVEPGITAIDQAGELACGADASTLRTALDIYEIREGRPAPDEATLVAEQYLREESQLWDVRDGRLVAQDPGCGSVPAEVPAEEIVTEPEPAADDETLDELADELATMTPDDILADATPAEIAEVGGRDCAHEVAEVGLAFARWSIDNDAEPASLLRLVESGYLEPLDLWVVGATELTAIPGTSCMGPVEMLSTPDDACRVEARTLEVAREAYFAMFPDADEPTQQDLVDADLIRDVSDHVDLVDGRAVPVDGGTCDGVELSGAATPAAGSSAERCRVDYTTLQVAIEAFAAQFGAEPENERQLVEAQMLRERFDSYDVVYGKIVPGDGSDCTVPPG
jgi:hypothetical protein